MHGKVVLERGAAACKVSFMTTRLVNSWEDLANSDHEGCGGRVAENLPQTR
jgi:hypothetical protein